MASLYDITKGEDVEFYRVLSRAGVDAELARAIIKRPELAATMIDAVREQLAPPLFSTPQEIYDRFVAYAGGQNWPVFDNHQVINVHQTMPVDHVSSLNKLLALDVWLGDLPTTFEGLAGWIEYQSRATGNGFRRWDELRSDAKHLRLFDSARYAKKPSVKWVELDMTANRGARPKDVRDKTSAGLQVMTAFAVHPNYPSAIDYDAIPGAWAAGLQASIPGREAWTDVPILSWSRTDREVSLTPHWDGNRDPDYAVPRVREL